MPNFPMTGSPEWKAQREAAAQARNEARRAGRNVPVPDYSSGAKVSMEARHAADQGVVTEEMPIPPIELQTKKEQEAEATRENIARLRVRLDAIKEAREQEADSDRRGLKQTLNETWSQAHAEDVDLSGIEEAPKPKIQEMSSEDEVLMQAAKTPELQIGHQRELEKRRDELTDQINNNAKKGLWNSLKLWGKRRELNQVSKQMEMSLDRYGSLRRDLDQAEKDLAPLLDVKLVNPTAKEKKKLLEAEVKKLKKELAPFEKAIKRANENK